MDMTLSETRRDLVALSARILGEAAEKGTSPARIWRLLADAGLLGIAVPEKFGGLGLDLTDVGLVLEEAGRAAAPVPLLEAAVVGVLLRDLGGPEALLRGLATGEVVFGLALSEPSGDPLAPLVCAAGDPGRWTLHGGKLCASTDPVPTHFLVSAHLAGIGPRLLVLAAGRAGVRPGSGLVTFDGIPIGPDDVLGELEDSGSVPLAVRCATVAACSMTAGCMAAALRLTATYTGTREQFGRPIGSFQAVGQRAADAFTAAWSVELTARQACWNVSSGSGPEVDRAVAVAKYTAATAGAEVIRAAHHLHGGIGLDRDYPLHRYTTLGKRLELSLGGACEQTALLGDVLAAVAVRAAGSTTAAGAATAGDA